MNGGQRSLLVSFCSSVLVYECVCFIVHVSVCCHVHSCMEAKDQHLVSPSVTLHIIFVTGSLRSPWLSRLACQWTQGSNCLHLHPRCTWPWVSELRSTCLHSRHFNPLNHTPAPTLRSLYICASVSVAQTSGSRLSELSGKRASHLGRDSFMLSTLNQFVLPGLFMWILRKPVPCFCPLSWCNGTDLLHVNSL